MLLQFYTFDLGFYSFMQIFNWIQFEDENAKIYKLMQLCHWKQGSWRSSNVIMEYLNISL